MNPRGRGRGGIDHDDVWAPRGIRIDVIREIAGDRHDPATGNGVDVCGNRVALVGAPEPGLPGTEGD